MKNARKSTVVIVMLAVVLSMSAEAVFAQGKAPETTMGQAFTLVVGGKMFVKDARLTIAFDKVLSDTRCPKDVTCAVVGDVRVQLTAEVKGKDPLVLELAMGKPEVEAFGFKVRAADLQPPKISGQTLVAADYKLTLVVGQ